MGDLRDLAGKMGLLGERVERRATMLQRKVAFNILSLVVRGTPVGNKNIWLEPKKAPIGYVGGRARANWFVGVGAAPGTVTDSVDTGGDSTISQGRTVIEGAPGGNVPIYLTNNLPYIIPLNEGHSHQAPAGFVDIAVLNGSAAVSSFRVTEEGSGGFDVD